MMQMAILAAGALVLLMLVFFAFAGPSASRAQAKQIEKIKLRHSDSDQTRVEAQMKKAANARRKQRRPSGSQTGRLEELQNRLERTGKHISVMQYVYGCMAIIAAVAVGLSFYGAPIYLAMALGLAVGAGVPHLVIGFMISRRMNRFNVTFPDAIELLVRGLRSGLPVTETIGVVAKEIDGPVGTEFSKVIDRIKIGQTMEDALQVSAKKLNTPEFKFFCITLAIQRETGGNLAETLSNLADVLRKRAQMKLKIKAMSSESKASAYIVGSLPFIVFGLVWTVNPTYLSGFFADDRLIIAGLGGLTWMSIGVFIMAKMVSFEI